MDSAKHIFSSVGALTDSHSADKHTHTKVTHTDPEICGFVIPFRRVSMHRSNNPFHSLILVVRTASCLNRGGRTSTVDMTHQKFHV